MPNTLIDDMVYCYDFHSLQKTWWNLLHMVKILISVITLIMRMAKALLERPDATP